MCGMGFYEWLLILVILGPPVLALIDVVTHEFSGNNKLVWLLVVLFLGPIGALLYFTLGRRQRLARPAG